MSEHTQLREIIFAAEIDQLKNLKIEDLNLFDIVISTLHTHFRKNNFSFDSIEHLDVLRNYLLNSALTILGAARLFKVIKPSFLLIFNGRMSQTRAMVQFCLGRKIQFATHERSLTRERFSVFYQDDCLSDQHARDIGDFMLNQPLLETQVLDVSNWILNRQNGTNHSWMNFNESNSKAAIRRRSNKKRWVMFTSSMDELVSEKRFNSPFGSQYDWILRTCEIASALDVDLVIRVHPTTKVCGANLDENSFFSSLHLKTNSNCVHILDSESKVNSYELIKTADLVLTYVSTIALESLLMGKRTYTAASNVWAHCPSMLSYRNCAKYEDFLINEVASPASSHLKGEDLIITYRFAYRFLFGSTIKLPFVEQVDHNTILLHVKDTKDFRYGTCSELDRAVDFMLGLSMMNSVSSTVPDPGILANERRVILEPQVILDSDLPMMFMADD